VSEGSLSLPDLAAAAASAGGGGGAGGGAAASGEFVLLGMPDVHGSVRGKAMRPDAFETALAKGSVMTDLLLALDPVDTPITTYERFGIRSGAGDLVVRPDPTTLRELAWLPGWRICLSTPVWPDGSPCELSSREALRGVLEQIRGLGYVTMAAFEYEVRLRDRQGRPLSSGLSYSLGEISRFEQFVARLLPALDALGVELAAVHTEAGPGLLELNIAAREGLRAADDAVFVKLAVKEVAAAVDLHASFLAKTEPGQEGSSGHVHLSCWAGGVNVFAGEPGADANQLPPLFSAAIAGILDHLPASSLMLNPTINSYKRLVPGWFAPVNVSWGPENRSCAVRAIRGEHRERWRIECRRPGADANPYVALTALGAMGGDGSPRGGDASERTDLPPLPGSLESALAAFDADADFRAAVGETFSDYYRTSRAWELDAWREAVSDWERDRYERTA
jgi:glutamine synthetase